MGWLLGHTFLPLVHAGRKTGNPCPAVAMSCMPASPGASLDGVVGRATRTSRPATDTAMAIRAVEDAGGEHAGER